MQQLELVLHGDENNPNYSMASQHVENCKACQSRLDDAALQPTSWWSEAKRSWLESELPEASSHSSLNSISIEIGSELPEDSRIEFETVMLSFLDPPSHPELLGRLGRYEVERVIGTGGMGIVLKAHDTELHRVVAIKILSTHLANNASARKRFSREAQAAAAVLHPNVIPIYNVESDGKVPYLVMKCVSGLSLQAKVDRFGMLPLTDTLRIAKQTASGLAAAHDQGLVHRDVKPANILMEENVDRVVLSDFGLARAVDDATLTRTGVVAGTPHYMSPEQARGDAIDTRSDQFSLGSVMYFMLTGRPPFRASGAMGVLHRICNEPHRSIEQINSDVPVEVVQLIDRLLAKDPSQRFETMHVVESELERLLAALQSGGLSLPRKQSPWIQSLSTGMAAVNACSKRSIKLAIPTLLGAVIAAFLIWRFVLIGYIEPRFKPLSIRRMIEEHNAAVQGDLQWQTDIERVERELRSMQISPTSSLQQHDDFDQQVRQLERNIEAISSQR